jgi:hypothetical protein
MDDPSTLRPASAEAENELSAGSRAGGGLLAFFSTMPRVLGSVAGVIVAITGLLAAVHSLVGSKPAATAVPSTAAQPTVVTSTETGARAGPPERLDRSLITASASVSAPAKGTLHYFASDTLDGNLATAWNGRGSSVGAILRYVFDRPVELLRIGVVNGYAKSVRSYEGNARLKDIDVLAAGRVIRRQLDDRRTWQSLAVGPIQTSSVALRIRSVYPGVIWNDAALTEIAFWVRPRG